MTPVGITSVIAGKILGVADLALVMSQLAWFIVTIVIGVFFYQLVIMQLIYLAFVRKNPFKFYAGLAQGTLTAFAMASTWVVDLRTQPDLQSTHIAYLTWPRSSSSLNYLTISTRLIAIHHRVTLATRTRRVFYFYFTSCRGHVRRNVRRNSKAIKTRITGRRNRIESIDRDNMFQPAERRHCEALVPRHPSRLILPGQCFTTCYHAEHVVERCRIPASVKIHFETPLWTIYVSIMFPRCTRGNSSWSIRKRERERERERKGERYAVLGGT